jgi:hypothetical protein
VCMSGGSDDGGRGRRQYKCSEEEDKEEECVLNVHGNGVEYNDTATEEEHWLSTVRLSIHSLRKIGNYGQIEEGGSEDGRINIGLGSYSEAVFGCILDHPCQALRRPNQ